MAITNKLIEEKLTARFENGVYNFKETYGMLSFDAEKELNLKILTFLFDDEELRFRFLTDLCGVHYPDNEGKELGVIYHLHNLEDNVRLRMKTYTGVQQPDIYTATGVFESANWMERETYDFFGINFLGHPNMIRILNVDEMDYSPLRKEFPLEDQTRRDKDDEMFGRGQIAIQKQ